ncbi:MAG: hypothetical protein RJB10_887 [Pseudomonadota bacterium]|jgi:hypothetical protein
MAVKLRDALTAMGASIFINFAIYFAAISGEIDRVEVTSPL